MLRGHLYTNWGKMLTSKKFRLLNNYYSNLVEYFCLLHQNQQSFNFLLQWIYDYHPCYLIFHHLHLCYLHHLCYLIFICGITPKIYLHVQYCCYGCYLIFSQTLVYSSVFQAQMGTTSSKICHILYEMDQSATLNVVDLHVVFQTDHSQKLQDLQFLSSIIITENQHHETFYHEIHHETFYHEIHHETFYHEIFFHFRLVVPSTQFYFLTNVFLTQTQFCLYLFVFSSFYLQRGLYLYLSCVALNENIDFTSAIISPKPRLTSLNSSLIRSTLNLKHLYYKEIPQPHLQIGKNYLHFYLQIGTNAISIQPTASHFLYLSDYKFHSDYLFHFDDYNSDLNYRIRFRSKYHPLLLKKFNLVIIQFTFAFIVPHDHVVFFADVSITISFFLPLFSFSFCYLCSLMVQVELQKQA